LRLKVDGSGELLDELVGLQLDVKADEKIAASHFLYLKLGPASRFVINASPMSPAGGIHQSPRGGRL
jgi:hypothetical protein